MTTTADVRAVLLEAEADPARRFALYRVAADAATDAGDDALAAGLVWLAGGRKAPWDNHRSRNWCWHVADDEVWQRDTARLPERFRQHMNGDSPHRWPQWLDYPTFPDAVIDAARAAGKELLP